MGAGSPGIPSIPAGGALTSDEAGSAIAPAGFIGLPTAATLTARLLAARERAAVMARMLMPGEPQESPLRNEPAQLVQPQPDPSLFRPTHSENLLDVTNVQHDSACVASFTSVPLPNTNLGVTGSLSQTGSHSSVLGIQHGGATHNAWHPSWCLTTSRPITFIGATCSLLPAPVDSQSSGDVILGIRNDTPPLLPVAASLNGSLPPAVGIQRGGASLATGIRSDVAFVLIRPSLPIYCAWIK